VLLLLGTFPFIVSVFRQELQTIFSGDGQRQSPWLPAWLFAAMVSIAADLILIRRARGGELA
jgi:hypothetical protein